MRMAGPPFGEAPRLGHVIVMSHPLNSTKYATSINEPRKLLEPHVRNRKIAVYLRNHCCNCAKLMTALLSQTYNEQRMVWLRNRNAVSHHEEAVRIIFGKRRHQLLDRHTTIRAIIHDLH